MFETDTRLRKIGDGVNRYNALDYLAAENIVQELGDSETATVSQKVVTEAIYEQKYMVILQKVDNGLQIQEVEQLISYF